MLFVSLPMRSLYRTLHRRPALHLVRPCSFNMSYPCSRSMFYPSLLRFVPGPRIIVLIEWFGYRFTGTAHFRHRPLSQYSGIFVLALFSCCPFFSSFLSHLLYFLLCDMIDWIGRNEAAYLTVSASAHFSRSATFSRL